MTRLHRFFPILLLILLGLLFVWKLAFTDMILARGDTYAYFYPYWDARNAAFRAGELPLWTPDIFMGAPLLANPQLGTFYPPNWLTIPFRAPDAIRLSILLHIIWAALGGFIMFRQTIIKTTAPALLAASVFALSGYLGAHVEQINQLQGLAWMPWLFTFLYQAITSQRRILWAILLAIGFAFQIFSGHTQTVFISGFGLGVFAIIQSYVGAQRDAPLMKIRSIGIALLTLLLASIVALLLATPQILPTLELTGMSNRGGGFNSQQATAFSLPPTYLGRALLPSYDGQLFGEYVGYIGVIALGLAILGMVTPSQPPPNSGEGRNARIIWIIIAIIGLTFAMGRFNPVYWQLADLPGFNLFRVPARWLSLYALAMSMLTGIGLHGLSTQKIDTKRLVLALVPLLLLMAIGRFVLVEQVDIVGSAVPTKMTLVTWMLGLVVFIGIVWLSIKTPTPQSPPQSIREGKDSTPPLNPLPELKEGKQATPPRYSVERGQVGEVKRWINYGAVAFVILELFLASRVLPYNDLTPRDVYEGQRFTISQLLAYNEDEIVPGRVLSISQLYFDPGDRARLLERYQQMGMDEQAIQTAFTAVKRQEMVFPNLSLTWGIPSIDGYEGGVLPTVYYSQFTSLMLPEGTPRTVDGRLGELMALPECRGACIPDIRWLMMTDTRYIITDKVYDVWHEGIAYDTAWTSEIDANQETDTTFIATFDNPTGFLGNEISIVYSGDDRPTAAFRFMDYVGNTSNADVTEIDIDAELHLIEFEFDFYIAPYFVQVFHEDFDNFNSSASAPVTILGVSIIDTRTGDFAQLVPELWSRVLSSDIKLYESQSQPRRAFHIHSVLPEQVFTDDWNGHEAAINMLHSRNDIRLTLQGNAEPLDSLDSGVRDSVEFLQYSPTDIEINSTTESEAYLFLADAYYPGWRATVNGEEVPIYRANVMFRAVRVPAGESTVVFEFVPMLWYYALAFGEFVWLIVIIAAGILWRRSQTR